MKNLVLAVCFLLFGALTGCNKETDKEKLAGSEWEAKIDDATIVLRFVDESNCTISAGRKGLYSMNMTTYFYRLSTDIDSWPGHFGVYETGDHLTIFYYGFIDKNEITLQSAAEWATEYPTSFKRK